MPGEEIINRSWWFWHVFNWISSVFLAAVKPNEVFGATQVLVNNLIYNHLNTMDMTGLRVNHVEEMKRISDGIITLQKPSTAQFVCIAVSVKVHLVTAHSSRCIVCDTLVCGRKFSLSFEVNSGIRCSVGFPIEVKPHANAKIRCTRKTEIMLWIA